MVELSNLDSSHHYKHNKWYILLLLRGMNRIFKREEACYPTQFLKTPSLGSFGVIEPATNYRETDVMLMTCSTYSGSSTGNAGLAYIPPHWLLNLLYPERYLDDPNDSIV